MNRTFVEAIKHRRSHYALKSESPISNKEIEELLKVVVKYVPSAFNSQTTRTVLLLGDNHIKLWDIVKETLKKRISAEAFIQTENKINTCFQSGYGTVLFFEDESIVKGLQKAFPSYADNFPGWSLQTSAMHQFATWTVLEDVGFGASLQHYNPLIDDEVRKTWNLPADWKLIAQMPFGVSISEPGEKEFKDLNERVISFE
ncbi:nitroreductase family protein [Bacteroides sp. 519]|uniref:nitroreductase family protein n=1 Tax=Bacteroides sp. 519 TaxID=2302937 RepID=UPI0013D783AF|nr:nitroreductase family protein [Bacteroides sp. 519]NDV58020.1 nitroreductase family protein [Bacteroides sp. 519]